MYYRPFQHSLQGIQCTCTLYSSIEYWYGLCNKVKGGGAGSGFIFINYTVHRYPEYLLFRGWRRGLFSSSHLYAVVNTTVPTTCHRLHSRRWLSWRRIAGQRAKLLPGSRHSSSFYPIPPRNSWIS